MIANRQLPLPLVLLLLSCGAPPPAATDAIPETLRSREQTTLAALLSGLAPAKGATYAPWGQETEIADALHVQWKDGAPVRKGQSLVRAASVRLVLPASPDAEEPAMEWDFLLVGNERGYDHAELVHGNSQEAISTTAEALIGEGGHVLREVQRCDASATDGFTKHELAFAHRSTGWLRVSYSAGTAGLGRSITYGFSPAWGKAREACDTE
ncbi:MAG: hypothetical protein QY325_04560 [Flavobacteriales bacterium]|nr:MAG: hypothetical protein QY325_04560 [Flavobacteriales bacterium]